MGEGGQRQAPAALPPEKNAVLIVQGLVGPQGRSGRVRKISPLLGFDPRTVQSVASRYIDWAIEAHNVRRALRNSQAGPQEEENVYHSGEKRPSV